MLAIARAAVYGACGCGGGWLAMCMSRCEAGSEQSYDVNMTSLLETALALLRLSPGIQVSTFATFNVTYN